MKPANGYEAVFGIDEGNLAEALFNMILHIKDIMLIPGEVKVSPEVF